MKTKQIRKVLVVYYAKHYGTLTDVKRALHKNDMTAYFQKRENEAKIKKLAGKVDAVIAVGGDGTLLRASHLIEDTPVLHVSSGSNVNEAFFSMATNKDANKKIGLLRKGKYKVIPLVRLEATLNGKRLPFKALNEVYAGSKTPYHTARYKLVIGGKGEEQKSSGVLVATPAGSNAWARSAGGKVLPLTAKKMQYVIREPYVGRLTKPKMLRGVLGANQKVTIVSDIWEKHKGIVVIDSHKREFSFNKGAMLVVKTAKQQLNLISF